MEVNMMTGLGSIYGVLKFTMTKYFNEIKWNLPTLNFNQSDSYILIAIDFLDLFDLGVYGNISSIIFQSI